MDFSFSFKKKPESTGSKPPPASPAQTQFDQLRACGINLRGHAQLAQVITGVSPDAFDDPPFAQLLASIGALREDGEPWSDDVFFLDPSWLADADALGAVVANLSRLAKGALPVEEIGVAFAEDNTAALSFTLDGEAAQCGANLAEEPGAWALIGPLAQIASERGEGAGFAMTPIGDAGFALVFLNDAELAELAETTSLEWSRLA